MTVYVVLGVNSYIYGVFDSEEKACEFGESEIPGAVWDVIACEVQ